MNTSKEDCVYDLGKALHIPTRLSTSFYSSLPVEDEPNMPASVAAPARPVVAAARSPLRDISPPPSPHPFSQYDDEMGLGTRRRRVPQQTQPSSFATPPPLRDIKGKGRAKLSSGSLSKVDDAGSDDYGMMGIDDDDFADADFLANLSRVEKEALTSSGDPNESQVSNTGGLDLSFMSVGGSSGSFVVVEGNKKNIFVWLWLWLSPNPTFIALIQSYRTARSHRDWLFRR
jgi:hypothetical protein